MRARQLFLAKNKANMVRLAAAVALFAGLSSVLGATGTSTASWLRKRATPVTGCTCCGFDVSFGSDIHNMITYVSQFRFL